VLLQQPVGQLYVFTAVEQRQGLLQEPDVFDLQCWLNGQPDWQGKPAAD
jgi:hypothetical protein